MNWKLIRAILILPGTVLVFIPATILLVSSASKMSPEMRSAEAVWFWVAIILAILGIALSSWTATLFMKFGEGTPAPWDPPKKLVVRGPYRYVRNPMITSVLLTLCAEAIFFQSWPIGIWMVSFFALNAIYFPLVEEKQLEKRFGAAYLEYKSHVPRWIPRLRAWTPEAPDTEGG
jgi:protein-S-isoprenylcysteine O-methyltransferase Ste14